MAPDQRGDGGFVAALEKSPKQLAVGQPNVLAQLGDPAKLPAYLDHLAGRHFDSLWADIARYPIFHSPIVIDSVHFFQPN
jgi:hypothetical protein